MERAFIFLFVALITFGFQQYFYKLAEFKMQENRFAGKGEKRGKGAIRGKGFSADAENPFFFDVFSF